MKGHTSENETVVTSIEHPPHVHRLLRLIREGTSSHASRASVLLGRYAALCITGASASSATTAKNDGSDQARDDDSPSPIISPSLLIWDLIGRLVGGEGTTTNNNPRKKNTHYQSGLFDPNWSTRCNCAMALEAVAKCLPVEDRRHFFEGDVWNDDDDDDDSNDLWLSVNDLHRVLYQKQANVELSKSTKDVQQKVKIKHPTNQSCEADTTEESVPIQNQLDIVVEKGRLLLSSSGEQYNWNCNEEVNEYIRENEALQNLDATMVGNDDAANVTVLDCGKQEQRQNEKKHCQLQQSFLQKRVALQRQILSKRLGLGGILGAPIMHGNNDDASPSSSSSSPAQKPSKRRRIVDDIVADDDLVVPEVVSSRATSINQRQQQNQETTTSNDNKLSSRDSPIGIRALLVLESKRSGNNVTGKGGSKHARHRNPQTLLGNELAYRTFDSEWTVRHGALLGTLSLLRAWRIHDSSTTSKSQQRLGKWPQDILARCVCILALDQFSDFSGSDLTTSNNKSENHERDDFVSNAVVAPVREMAAQIVAILLEVSPLEVWNCTHELLMQLYTGNHNRNRHERGSQWEISHGVLLAWKYIIAVTLFQSNAKQARTIPNLDGQSSSVPRPLSSRMSRHEQNETSDRYQRVFTNIILHAVKGISDGNDDNRAVSAQILRYCMQLNSQFHTTTIVPRCSGPLWIAVTKIGTISVCASDLLSLLAEVLSRDCASFLCT